MRGDLRSWLLEGGNASMERSRASVERVPEFREGAGEGVLSEDKRCVTELSKNQKKELWGQRKDHGSSQVARAVGTA